MKIPAAPGDQSLEAIAEGISICFSIFLSTVSVHPSILQCVVCIYSTTARCHLNVCSRKHTTGYTCKSMHILPVCVCACVYVYCSICLIEAWVLPCFDRGSPQIRSKSGPGGMPASLRGKWDVFTKTKSASIWPQRALYNSEQQPATTSPKKHRFSVLVQYVWVPCPSWISDMCEAYCIVVVMWRVLESHCLFDYKSADWVYF